jgi:putative endonuclease
MYFVYLLQCADGTIYTGITTDVARRFLEHKNKKGGHYTATHGAKSIIYTEQFANRSLASKRETKIKKLPRTQKLYLANNPTNNPKIA